jgi:hypothetical protein
VSTGGVVGEVGSQPGIDPDRFSLSSSDGDGGDFLLCAFVSWSFFAGAGVRGSCRKAHERGKHIDLPELLSSSTEEIKGDASWMSQRPEVAYMAPMSWSDGLCPVVSIAYRDDFLEFMVYFGARR